MSSRNRGRKGKSKTVKKAGGSNGKIKNVLEYELMYRAVVDNIGIGVAVISPEMEILALNKQMKKWFPKADPSKRPICYKVFNDPPKENICSYCPTCETLRDGKVHESITDTHIGDEVRNFRVISSPVKDVDGRVIAAIEIVEDITKQRKILEELQEKMETFHTITNTAKDAIIMVDDKGCIIYWNPAAEHIFGYSADEVIGKELHLLIAPKKYRKAYQEGFKNFKGSGKGKIIGKTIELDAVRKNGEEFPIELSLSAIQVKGRWHAVGIARDITRRKKISDELKKYQENLEEILSERTAELKKTNEQLNLEIEERKKAEEKLIQLNEILRMINKILRHDILNELTVVSGSIEVYKENRDKRLLDSAYKSVERSVELIKKMRELEALVATGGSLKPFSARELIEEVLSGYIDFEERKIDITVNGDATILADEAFSSVVSNMIRNSIIHGKADRIEITIEKKGDFCEIRIADNGEGIPDEIKEEIFEEGFSGDSKSTGLGLYIARKTIERYGGSIKVEDNHPSGAVFIITLKTVSDYSGIRSSLRIPVSGSSQQVLVKEKDDSERKVEEIRMPKEIELDLKGLKCPQPILKLHTKVVTLAKGTILKVVADCPTFERDLKIWAAKTGKTVLECVKNGGIWRARIRA